MRTVVQSGPMDVTELAFDIGASVAGDPSSATDAMLPSAETDAGPVPLELATIMMVDDEPTVMDVIQMFLEDKGYKNFLTVSESREAMETLRGTPPDLLLLDLMMPGVSGFDILTGMRADRTLSRIPVIVLTSSSDAPTKLKALELGATDFLAKPVDESELVLRVRNNLAAKIYQDRLLYCDALTGLPNRRLFLERLDRALGTGRAAGEKLAVLHIDLDRFKQINDVMGHSTGDALLKLVARRLARCARGGELTIDPKAVDAGAQLARTGGDEFTGLLRVEDSESVDHVARRLLKALSDPFQIDGEEFFVTASIGIGVFPDDGADVDTLLKHADIAMSYAKERGRDGYQFYSEEMNARSKQRLSLENHLRRAVEREEFLLCFQPQVDVSTGRVTGAEALIRWQHPELGMVSPGEFIPIAEETGLIVPIGEWVIATACRQVQAWRAAGLAPLRISVNVSSRQFRQQGLVGVVGAALQASGVPGTSLVVELTESMVMENPTRNLQTLEELKALGVGLSVDDFGTGYSSLSYLKRLPLDELKVDRSFIKDLPTSSDDAAIVTAIIAMAHSLGLTVVAEGVESEPQLAFLRDRHCDEYQGYLFSKPVPAGELAAQFLTQPQAGDAARPPALDLAPDRP